MVKRQVKLWKLEQYKENFRGLILSEVYQELNADRMFLVGAVEESQPVGAAIWQLEGHLVRLCSIVVDENFRRRGIGTALLRYSMKVMHQLDCHGIYTLLGEDEQLELFLKSYGFEADEARAKYYELSLGELKESSFLKSGGLHTKSLGEITHKQYQKFISERDQMLWEKGLFDPVTSRMIEIDGKISGSILIEALDGKLSVAWLSSDSGKAADLMYLMHDAFLMGIENHPEETRINFTCYDEAMQKLAEKIIGKSCGIYVLQKWGMYGYKYRLAETAASKWETEE